jgi:hypothetical protein
VEQGILQDQSESVSNFFIWQNSKTESFLDINKKSNIKDEWLVYSRIKDSSFKDSILKPINLYVKMLYPAPILISDLGSSIILQQRTHAEIFLLQKPDEFYNVDRPHMRQYYLSDQKLLNNKECFPETFRFYLPWVIDADIDVSILQPENSPFLIQEGSLSFRGIDQTTEYIDPPMIYFNFKSIGDHMVEKDFAKIKRLSPICNIEISGDGIIIERLRKFYANN